MPRLQSENAFGKIPELHLEFTFKDSFLRKYHGWSHEIKPDSVLETHFNKGKNLPTKICFQSWNIWSQDSKLTLFRKHTSTKERIYLQRFIFKFKIIGIKTTNTSCIWKYTWIISRIYLRNIIFDKITRLELCSKSCFCFGNTILQRMEFTFVWKLKRLGPCLKRKMLLERYLKYIINSYSIFHFDKITRFDLWR